MTMIFSYKAKDSQGVIRQGVVESSSIIKAAEVLHSNGLTVLSLEPEEAEFSFEHYLPFLGRIPIKELVLFSRQLSTLIHANVPIVQAMEILQ